MQSGWPDLTRTFYVSRPVLTIDRIRDRRDQVQCVYRALCAGTAPAFARPAADRLRDLLVLINRCGGLGEMDHPGDNGKEAPPVDDTRSPHAVQDTDFVELWADRINLRLALIECLTDCSEDGEFQDSPGRRKASRKAMRLKRLKGGRNANRRGGGRRAILFRRHTKLVSIPHENLPAGRPKISGGEGPAPR